MEILFIVLLAGGMLLPGVVMGLKTKKWHLLYIFLAFFICFGLIEWLSTVQTGQTVSQQIWEYGETNPIAFWISIGAYIVAWAALMFHFMEKKFKE